MKKYFPLDGNHSTEQYSAIAETVKHFYPANMSPFEKEYHEYSGMVEWVAIIRENIGNNKTFKKRWSTFLNKVRKDSGKQINDTTLGSVPGFSADLILENFENETLTYTKRIAFAVSLLGPFFTVCGVDETLVKGDPGNFDGNYRAINVVTASPYKEFKSNFNGVRYLLEKKFPGYKFVPFYIAMMPLQNVETMHSMGQEGTVYNALFNHLFNYYTHFRSRGDNYYGMEKNSSIKVTLSPPPND